MIYSSCIDVDELVCLKESGIDFEKVSQFGKIPEIKPEKPLDTIREYDSQKEGNILGVSKSSIPKSKQKD